MLPLPVGREASLGVAASAYERHRPERTLLYQLVEEHYPAFKAHLAAQGTLLPRYVEREFEERGGPVSLDSQTRFYKWIEACCLSSQG